METTRKKHWSIDEGLPKMGDLKIIPVDCDEETNGLGMSWAMLDHMGPKNHLLRLGNPCGFNIL